MGASESALSKPPPQWRDDEITTVSEGPQGRAADPILRRLQSLTVAAPLLTAPSAEAEPDGSLTDILLRKPPSASSSSGNLNPNVLLELFSLYREWQEEKAKKISKKQFCIIKRRRNLEISLFQYCLICNPNYGPYRHSLDVWEEIENKIETADALAVKLLRRFNNSVTSMRSTAHNLAEVHPLQVEVGELKGRLTEVINNCDALCKRIAAEGPESLRSSIQPFTASTVEVGGSGSLQPKPDC